MWRYASGDTTRGLHHRPSTIDNTNRIYIPWGSFIRERGRNNGIPGRKPAEFRSQAENHPQNSVFAAETPDFRRLNPLRGRFSGLKPSRGGICGPICRKSGNFHPVSPKSGKISTVRCFNVCGRPDGGVITPRCRWSVAAPYCDSPIIRDVTYAWVVTITHLPRRPTAITGGVHGRIHPIKLTKTPRIFSSCESYFCVLRGLFGVVRGFVCVWVRFVCVSVRSWGG